MQYPYRFTDLTPLNIRPIGDDIHVVYDLPAPKKWQFNELTREGELVNVLHIVNRIRVYLTQDEFTGRPYAGVVPYDQHGLESPASAIHFDNVYSIIGVLNQLGFEPILPEN